MMRIFLFLRFFCIAEYTACMRRQQRTPNAIIRCVSFMGKSAKISKVSRTGRLPFKQKRLKRELLKRRAQNQDTKEPDLWSTTDELTQLRAWRQRKKQRALDVKEAAPTTSDANAGSKKSEESWVSSD